ncbi:MAG: CoA-binding protein [Deltaproteobacteria bacterium]|nr:CoA-binding protein [Deltaproteobacteria bacterium]
MKRIAVVGLSPKKDRPSHRVAEYLVSKDYDIIPVNPNCKEVFGRKCYKSLLDVPGDIDVVDIFRRREDVMPIVEAAIKIQAKAIWMQEGVVNEEAAKKARQTGINVVMDRCMLKEHVKTTQISKRKSQN